MRKRITGIFVFLLFSMLAYNIFAIQRFPKPEFESKYQQPKVQTPPARSDFMGYVDLAILISTLSLASWLALKKRSRNGIFWLSVFSLAYFGFYREGCICPVGSLQNVTLGLFNPTYQIPLLAIAFFIIPLFFTLFFGRTFCAGVCPLGAIQDIVALRPISLKGWVQSLLGLIPFIYLGLAVLYAATATDFVICRYDPFVGFWRFSGSFMMLSIGGSLLLMGVFISRPYCRFLCPYGVLLNLVSRISKNHLTITPTTCIDCKLCTNSCPFGAINKPSPTRNMESRNTTVKRYTLYLLIVPLFLGMGAWAGSSFHENLAKVNSKVRLAIALNKPAIPGVAPSVEITTFKSSGKDIDQFYAETEILMKKFHLGGILLGGFVGLVFGLTLVRLSVYRHHIGYTPNKGTCFSCARCIDFCPVMPGSLVDGLPVINKEMLKNAEDNPKL
jgi:NosR/NirI family nitrous oxide reductase transcriptional regulator